MASFKCYMFHASTLVVLFCMTFSIARVRGQSINTLCSKTSVPTYCKQLLGSTPGAATADLKGLAKITLNLANSKASTTLAQLNTLTPKTTDPKLQSGYKTCSEHFDNAIGALKDSEADFNKRDYSGMNVQASAAMTEVGDCIDAIKGLAVDPSIKKGSQDLDQTCRVILAAANLL